MDLKVQIDNSSRLVCGLNNETTVHEVIVALANSLGQTGRFYLIEKIAVHRPNRHTRRASFKAQSARLMEPRIMAPDERPLEILKIQNKLLSENEFIEFHLFKSKYLALKDDFYSEKLIEKELIEKLDSLVDRPAVEEKNTYFHSHHGRSFHGQRGSMSYETIQNGQFYANSSFDYQNNYCSGSSTSRSSLNSPTGHYSNSSESSSMLNSCPNEEDDLEERTLNECKQLLDNIKTQQSTLEGQSEELDDLLKNIESYEITMLHINQQNESVKVTLNNLELLNCINSSKLGEMERETNQMKLLKEIEFNDYLCAQRDYYERRLNEMSKKFEYESEQLKSLNNILTDLNNQPEPDHNLNSEADAVLEKLNSAQKISDLNRARLDYLQVSHSNLEKCLKEKENLIKVLENQLTTIYPDHSINDREIKILVEERGDNETKTYMLEEETIEQYANLGTEYESQNQTITEIEDDEEFSIISSITDNEIQPQKNVRKETEDNNSLMSLESSNTSENSNSHEVMASFLRYKRIREKALEKSKNKSGAAATEALQQEYTDDSFNEVFNTIHYF